MSEERRRGEVVSFPKPGASRRAVRASGGGTVLLFTGVRYERAADDMPPPPPAGRTSPAGDRRIGG